ncbi:MAG: ATP-binding protein [Firmicutes bacterium]|nr:ATP-binding protein [Bacillota bacterium]
MRIPFFLHPRRLSVFPAWFKSLHGKLFLVTALLTSGITVAVAYQINRNSRKEAESRSKNLALETARAVEAEIHARDPEMTDPRKIEEIIGHWAGPDRSIFQIDVFQSLGRQEVALRASSRPEDDPPDYGDGIGTYLTSTGGKPAVEMVPLNTGNNAWKVYYPIANPRPRGGPSIGLVRVYCDLERWEEVWRANLKWTLRLLPSVLIGEFILLWLLLGSLVRDPLKSITSAMRQLEKGDARARAEVQRKDELGQIAQRFNQMATQLERASTEREVLMGEIQGLNTHLQERIDAALVELQIKNKELEQLVERNSLLREELSQQERLAVAGQLTAAFAHEVGTPLNLVHSHLQLLHTQPDLNDRARERLSVIQAQIERVGEIVRKLLGHTRRPRLNQERLEFADLLTDLQRLWAPTLASHQVRLEAHAPTPCTLWVDRKQMEQIFINLVNNAVDAMPDGGLIQLTVQPDEAAPKDAPRWRFALQDEGTGIPADLLTKVFRPMFTTKPEGKGTGLGLPIVREIVRAHGGDVILESREGEGTTVHFTLPGTA